MLTLHTALTFQRAGPLAIARGRRGSTACESTLSVAPGVGGTGNPRVSFSGSTWSNASTAISQCVGWSQPHGPDLTGQFPRARKDGASQHRWEVQDSQQAPGRPGPECLLPSPARTREGLTLASHTDFTWARLPGCPGHTRVRTSVSGRQEGSLASEFTVNLGKLTLNKGAKKSYKVRSRGCQPGRPEPGGTALGVLGGFPEHRDLHWPRGHGSWSGALGTGRISAEG